MTTPSEEEARNIGKTLVEERLAACVNLLPGMQSIYRWEGRLEEAHETVLIAKTAGGSVKALIARVKALHSYEVPCIICLPIVGGNAEFLEWIQEQTD